MFLPGCPRNNRSPSPKRRCEASTRRSTGRYCTGVRRSGGVPYTGTYGIGLTARVSAMMTSPQEYQRVVLEILPDQGLWSEDRYLWLTDYTSRLIEFTDGYLEVLPMPTDEHQGILAYLEDEVKACQAMRDGVVRFSPLRLRLRE